MDRESQLSRRTRRTTRRGGQREEEDNERRRTTRGGGEEEERRTRQEEEEATDIKSNNPHLAGGEIYIPSGYDSHSHGKSPFLIGKR